jgi:hypothetical protein
LEKLRSKITQQIRSGRRGSNSQLSAWESKFSILYFQYLQNRPETMYVHALHAVHALPDLRIVGGRLGDGVSVLMEPSTLLDQQWLAGMR